MAKTIMRPGSQPMPWPDVPAGYVIKEKPSDYQVKQDEFTVPANCWYPSNSNRLYFVGIISGGSLVQDATLRSNAQAAEAAKTSANASLHALAGDTTLTDAQKIDRIEQFMKLGSYYDNRYQ